MNFENYTTFLQVGLTCVQVTSLSCSKLGFGQCHVHPTNDEVGHFELSMSWNSPWLVDICSIISGVLLEGHSDG